MKKLYVGLVALVIAVNIIAMEQRYPQRRRIHPQDRIGLAYEQLNTIIRRAYPFGPTDWNAIFAILDSTPEIDINQYNTPDGETLLENALEDQNFVAAKRLLQHYNANPERVVNPGDKTPLQIILRWEKTADIEEMIAVLQDYSARWKEKRRREKLAGG